jgi:hypothetical protein
VAITRHAVQTVGSAGLRLLLLYLRVLKDGTPTDCVIESDVPAHPYQVMGVGSRRDWRISLTLDEIVAIKS